MDKRARVFLSPPDMGGREIEYVKEVFDSNYIAPLGEFVDRFENSISNYTKSPYVLALNSGTSAIHLALRVAGVESGDKVLAPSFTFVASVSPILYQGAEPILIDSDGSWNIDPNLIEDAIKKESPKALIITHLYGQSCDMDSIVNLCDRFGVVLIEDNAEALGAKYKNLSLGTFGRFGAVSFNGNKILTTGGGGALLCQNREDYILAKKLSTQAKEDTLWYEHREFGYNYRLSNVLAAIGVAQMELIESRVKKKREIFKHYFKLLGGVDEVEFMSEIEGSFGSRWLTTLLFRDSNPLDVIKTLDKSGIESRPLWKPMHLQPLFKRSRFYGTDISEKMFQRGICLPSGTALSKEQIEKIARIVKESML